MYVYYQLKPGTNKKIFKILTNEENVWSPKRRRIIKASQFGSYSVRCAKTEFSSKQTWQTASGKKPGAD